MTAKLIDPKAYALISDAVAAELHEGWRKDHKKTKGDAPRWKTTTDAAWWAKFCTAKCARGNGNAYEVDINIPFADLPADWQAENKAAAEFAVRIVMNRILLGEPEDSESLSHQIHEAWLVRQRLQSVEADKVPYYRTAGQAVPYDQLTEDEKQKDRVQLAIAERHVAALLA